MISRIRKAMSCEKGFTLVELLVVIGIIGILAMLLLPQFRGMRDRARIASCQSNLKNIGTTLESFYADQERYPRPGEFTSMAGGGGQLEKLAKCPQDKVVYTYLPGTELDPSTQSNGVYDWTGLNAVADDTATRIDAYIVYCTFHDGSGTGGSDDPRRAQLFVTQNGVERLNSTAAGAGGS